MTVHPVRWSMVAALVVLAACGSARRSAPLGAPPLPATSTLVQGERAFMRACHACHPGGEAGLGPALNDKPLPGFLVSVQVRRGFGAMPAFEPHEISDDDLAALLEYLRARRRG